MTAVVNNRHPVQQAILKSVVLKLVAVLLVSSNVLLEGNGVNALAEYRRL
jgi:hypothetical protein